MQDTIDIYFGNISIYLADINQNRFQLTINLHVLACSTLIILLATYFPFDALFCQMHLHSSRSAQVDMRIDVNTMFLFAIQLTSFSTHMHICQSKLKIQYCTFALIYFHSSLFLDMFYIRWDNCILVQVINLFN